MTDNKPNLNASPDATPLPTNGANSATPYDGKPDDLHDLIGSPANSARSEEDDPLAALRNDPNYSALIRDLEYIASQARLLFEPSESAPSDAVWDKIQSKLGEAPGEDS